MAAGAAVQANNDNGYSGDIRNLAEIVDNDFCCNLTTTNGASNDGV